MTELEELDSLSRNMAKTNIIVCGTPGTGKTSLIERLKPKLSKFYFINLSQYAIEYDCVFRYERELETRAIDRKKLLRQIEPILRLYNQNVIEVIHSSTLPKDLVTLVFVCRTNNTILYDRLKDRGYNEKKLKNNVEAEIFQLIADEAKNKFGESIVTELHNNELADLDKNVDIVLNVLIEHLRSKTQARVSRVLASTSSVGGDTTQQASEM